MRQTPASTALARLATRLAVCGLALTVGAGSLAAQSRPAQADEDAVKAAFLFNFAKFVQWPARTTGPIVICVAAEDTFSDAVVRLVRGNIVDTRALTARPIKEPDDPAECQLLFVSALRQKHGAELLQRLQGPTLTIGETVQFMRDGGMVRLFVEDSRLRFQINQKAAESAGLKLSSKVLALSR